MSSQSMSYEDGYNAAYAEIYATLDDLDHPRRCDGCRPCGVMKASLEWAMRSLSRKLTHDEFYTLARLPAKAEAEQQSGTVSIDRPVA